MCDQPAGVAEGLSAASRQHSPDVGPGYPDVCVARKNEKRDAGDDRRECLP